MDQDARNIPAGFRVVYAERGRSVRVPALLARLLGLLIVLGLMIVRLVLFVPLAIFGALALFVTLGVVWVRAKIARAKAPNGILDGRRNVRVRG